MIGLLVVATGKYREMFLDNLLASARTYFPPYRSVVFTDYPRDGEIQVPHRRGHGIESSTRRYRWFLQHADVLQQFDHLFYLDADMLFVSPVKESDILTEGITAVIHPDFTTDWCRIENSTAYIRPGDERTYYFGALQGGSRDAFLNMCAVLADRLDADDKNGVIRNINNQPGDEEQLNRFLLDNPPAIALSPWYAYPQGFTAFELWRQHGVKDDVPKIVHICKDRSIRDI